MRQSAALETHAATSEDRLLRQATLWQAVRLATPAAVLALGLLSAGPARAQESPLPPKPGTATTAPARSASPTPATLPLTPSIDQSFEGLTIVRVEVVGNTRTDAKTILDQVRTQAGQVYHRAAVDQDVRTIAAMERLEREND